MLEVLHNSLSLSGRQLQMTNSTQRAHLNVGGIAQLSLPLRETATDDKFYTASSPKCWRYCTTLSERQLQMTNSTQRAHLNVGCIAQLSLPLRETATDDKFYTASSPKCWRYCIPLRETATDDKFYTASSPKCWRYCTTLSERQLQMTNSTQRAHLNVGCIAQLSLPLRETATDDKFYTASSPKCWRYCTTFSERQLQMTNSTQ